MSIGPSPLRALRTDRHLSMPQPATPLHVNLRFTAREYQLLQLGHRAADMDDHWSIYFDPPGRQLAFHRSWTGFCIFLVTLAEDPDGGCHTTDAWANPDAQQFRARNPGDPERLLLPLFNLLLQPATPSTPSYTHNP